MLELKIIATLALALHRLLVSGLVWPSCHVIIFNLQGHNVSVLTINGHILPLSSMLSPISILPAFLSPSLCCLIICLTESRWENHLTVSGPDALLPRCCQIWNNFFLSAIQTSPTDMAPSHMLSSSLSLTDYEAAVSGEDDVKQFTHPQLLLMSKTQGGPLFIYLPQCRCVDVKRDWLGAVVCSRRQQTVRDTPVSVHFSSSAAAHPPSLYLSVCLSLCPPTHPSHLATHLATLPYHILTPTYLPTHPT